MCGITGFNWEDKKTLKEMTDIINYRGPDQYDYYADRFVSLGHRRLNIIDLSEKGRQPMCNEDATIWIVYNGEIYNFMEIKRDLEKSGHRFKSATDTEVIIHAYEEYGFDFLKKLNGMFAFIIWDSKNKRLIFARDRLGVKPLFYYYDSIRNKLVFASEIKSVLQNPEVKKKVNYEFFNQILIYAHSVNNQTMIKNVMEVPPGHFLVYDFKSLKIEKYWDFEVNVKYKSEGYFVSKLKDLLKESIGKRLVSDVSLGASLSGGLDSSSVVAFMSQAMDRPVKTFTVGFNDESDELREAKIVSDFFGTDHNEIIVDSGDVTKIMPKVLWHAEMPFEKPAMYATYFLSRGINKKGVTVDLSGEGSDELFAGYNRSGIFFNEKISDSDKVKGMLSGHFVDASERNFFFDDRILNHANESFSPEKIILPEIEKSDRREILNNSLKFEIKKQLSGVHLMRLDRMSMANSHEIREPFVDYNLVEFGMTIPSTLKWNGVDKKYILQKAMSGILPDEITRRKKMPFHMPLQKQFSENIFEICKSVIFNSDFLKEALKRENIVKKISEIKDGKNDDKTLRQMLFIMNAGLFGKLFIEKEKVHERDLNLNNFL